jgi:hypothetical protein
MIVNGESIVLSRAPRRPVGKPRGDFQCASESDETVNNEGMVACCARTI